MKTLREIKNIVWRRYQVEVPVSRNIKPDKIDPRVYGHHASYVEYEVRIWGFESREGYNKFKKDYNL